MIKKQLYKKRESLQNGPHHAQKCGNANPKSQLLGGSTDNQIQLFEIAQHNAGRHPGGLGSVNTKKHTVEQGLP